MLNKINMVIFSAIIFIVSACTGQVTLSPTEVIQGIPSHVVLVGDPETRTETYVETVRRCSGGYAPKVFSYKETIGNIVDWTVGGELGVGFRVKGQTFPVAVDITPAIKGAMSSQIISIIERDKTIELKVENPDSSIDFIIEVTQTWQKGYINITFGDPELTRVDVNFLIDISVNQTNEIPKPCNTLTTSPQSTNTSTPTFQPTLILSDKPELPTATASTNIIMCKDTKNDEYFENYTICVSENYSQSSLREYVPENELRCVTTGQINTSGLNPDINFVSEEFYRGSAVCWIGPQWATANLPERATSKKQIIVKKGSPFDVALTVTRRWAGEMTDNEGCSSFDCEYVDIAIVRPDLTVYIERFP